MKAIDELIEKYRTLSEKFKEDNTLIDVIQDLETLKEQMKEQHKEDVEKNIWGWEKFTSEKEQTSINKEVLTEYIKQYYQLKHGEK